MDELLEIAQRTMENFNPATDKVYNNERVGDGVYDCLLEKVTNRVSNKGTPYVSFDFSVLDDNIHSHIFVPYYFSEKTIERSIKILTKLAYEFGYELPTSSFENLETLAQTLDSMAGNQAVVEVKTPIDKTTNEKKMPVYKITPIK